MRPALNHLPAAIFVPLFNHAQGKQLLLKHGYWLKRSHAVKQAVGRVEVVLAKVSSATARFNAGDDNHDPYSGCSSEISGGRNGIRAR
ncbi:hypothetical protein [Erwinia psidii]|uniref:Uncharacterized protein n=1 Tax=Erwinia psidii TaxID=69224 RepID=A0A3N6RU11_9GAMM|nr:hypothetical protein [Erwinia psidii]MCX8959509.1 hypothetical protein [Erwinia psidii]MCX8963156.1 hypothetical protein [Erwinia psidii]MCX8966965.1 hypothetical protein [Erwinia psidii]RQM36468.1 hypothetical protein EB241_20235 [Erwinia psidii]